MRNVALMKQCYGAYHISTVSVAFEEDRDKFKIDLSVVVKMEHG
jgi:hypothetical protein